MQSAVEEALARAADDRWNAFVELRPEAVAEARGAVGPLAGTTLAVKDAFVDRDRIPTCGSRAHGTWLQGTATVVERLRAAGAVVVAYTNLHEWCVGTTSAVTATGPILNPRDPTRLAGGSSGGSAVAVAAGIVEGALGSDAGGSIRVPAACCGVVGLKPTHGRVPMAGFVGDGGGIDHVGPLARSVDHAARLLGVMTGEEVRLEDPSRLRLGIAEPFFFEDLDSAVEAEVRAAVEILGGLVAEVRTVALPSAALASFAVPALLLPLFARRLDGRFDLLQPATARVVELGRDATEADVAEARRVQSAVVADWERAFEEVDVVVTPTIPGPAPPVETPTLDLPSGPSSAELAYLRWNAPMNLGGVPALSLPCGPTTSMTLSAARGRDDLVLGLGRAFECA